MAKRTIASTNISIGANLTGLQTGLKIAQRSLRKFGASAKRMGSSITSNVTLPFAAAGAAGVKLATDLETSFAKIENLVGITGQALQDFKNAVREVSSATGQSQQQLSEALFTVASAGLRGAQATDVLEMSAKASAIGLGETKEVAQALTGVLQAYAKSGLTASEATDTLTAIVREGNLEAEALAPTLGRVVGIAAQLGISFQEVGANIATFTRLGVPAEEAVVGLRGVMTTFLKPTTEAQDALATLGLTAADLREMLGTQGLQSTLHFLMESFKGNDEALASVFGNVRALAAVLGTAGAQGETYAEVLNNISNATGIVDQGFENVSKTSGFQFQQTLNTLKSAAIELGAALLPMVTKISNFITRAIKGFQSLSSETKSAVLTLTALVAASGPIIAGIGAISTALAALLTPTGLVIAAVVAIAAAFYIFWDDIKPIFVKIINAWIDLYNESQSFRFAVEFLKYVFKNLWSGIKVVFENILGGFKNIGRLIVGILSFDKSMIVDALSDMKQGFAEVSMEIGDEVEKNFAEMMANLNPKKKVELITEEGLQKGIDDFVRPITSAWEKVTGMFSFGGGGSTQETKEQAEAIEDLGNKTEETTTKVEESTNKIAQFFQRMGEGLTDSLEQAASTIQNFATNVIAQAVITMGSALAGGRDAFKSFGNFALAAFASMAEQLGRLAISVGVAALGIKKALMSLNPAAAIAGGAALLLLAGAARARMQQIAENQNQVKLAKGGLAFGETLAVVGDNPNARMDPEVIAPLSKLKNILAESGGGGRVEVYGRLSGQDILLSSEKATRTRSRYRGF